MSHKGKFAKMRTDLWNGRLSVPVGESYFLSQKKVPYRWIGDETFQVFYKGKWQEAQSIDWEFIN